MNKIELPFESYQFSTVYADPPWPESGGGKVKRGADNHYSLMTLEQINNLGSEVGRVTCPAAHLYIWTTNNYFEDCLRVIATWGFNYKTCITWIKGDYNIDSDGFKLEKPGLGQYYRGLTEHCLFAVRGALPYRTLSNGKRAQGVTAFVAPRGEHSEKPEHMRTMIERVSYSEYLELFARKEIFNWSSWGNELDSGE